METLHLLLPQTNIRQQNDWTCNSTQGAKHRIDFVGIAEAAQPQVHSCAPTYSFLLGSEHFQDHFAVMLEFSTAMSTNLQVAHECRPAVCDRELLAQESVQSSFQQWWQATPLPPTGLTPNQGEALLARWMRHGLSCGMPKSLTAVAPSTMQIKFVLHQNESTQHGFVDRSGHGGFFFSVRESLCPVSSLWRLGSDVMGLAKVWRRSVPRYWSSCALRLRSQTYRRRQCGPMQRISS